MIQKIISKEDTYEDDSTNYFLKRIHIKMIQQVIFLKRICIKMACSLNQ